MRTLVLVVVLVLVGCAALPLSALVLDGSDTGENLIVPVQVLLTTASGALLGRALLDRERPVRQRLLLGAGLGVVGALVGIVGFFLLLNGIDGA
ncbi:hypothetical protein KVF89_19270 [Nocardioides carbamazepini]|uniref:hypothetical protein n=1 Tax=Nocardioides carbamazepini TaxID=2854259 RepID=UPI002149B0F5|nr:hypothetical protein [Nocardioides carbamazepini]MCR1784692.1 hypothetical protein [Nocardioides carbamazepini]